MITRHHHPDNGHGWRMALKQCFDPDTLVPGRRPLVIIPGYGMNSFIFGFHPNGPSMEAHFVDAGYEVWSINLRGQGNSQHLSGPRHYGLRELALVDLPFVMDFILDTTRTEADALTPIGCSLGASLMYIYLAHNKDNHVFGEMISIGGPLRWDTIHPAVKVVFASPRLAGMVPLRGTRKLARLAIPVAKKIPAILSIYMNPAHVDLSQADVLVQTVDDPNRRLNKQLARWINDKDLVVDGLNITEALRGEEMPLLCILANADGIVTPEAALSATSVFESVEVMKVGNDAVPFAHADLFISRYAHQWVFQPLVEWLQHPAS